MFPKTGCKGSSQNYVPTPHDAPLPAMEKLTHVGPVLRATGRVMFATGTARQLKRKVSNAHVTSPQHPTQMTSVPTAAWSFSWVSRPLAMATTHLCAKYNGANHGTHQVKCQWIGSSREDLRIDPDGVQPRKFSEFGILGPGISFRFFRFWNCFVATFWRRAKPVHIKSGRVALIEKFS